MIIGVCRVVIHIPGSASLKDKRRQVKSLKDRIRNTFNVSVAEIEDKDLWQRAVLGIACVSEDKNRAAEIISGALSLIKNSSEVIVTDSQIDFS